MKTTKMKTQPKMKTITSSRTPADKDRLRRLQIETIREITMKVLAKCGAPMTPAEIRSSNRKRTKSTKDKTINIRHDNLNH